MALAVSMAMRRRWLTTGPENVCVSSFICACTAGALTSVLIVFSHTHYHGTTCSTSQWTSEHIHIFCPCSQLFLPKLASQQEKVVQLPLSLSSAPWTMLKSKCNVKKNFSVSLARSYPQKAREKEWSINYIFVPFFFGLCQEQHESMLGVYFPC